MKPLEKVNIVPEETSSAIVSMDPLVAMIERAARDPSIDMDRLERLLAMKERSELKAAEGEFNDAMAQVQQELLPIARDSNNPQTHSKYASYFAIDKAIRPIYTRHGIRVSFDESDVPVEDHVRVIAIVTKGRHAERYHYDSPIITKGMKGNEMMTLTHARASAVTYAKRYLVGMIFNLSTGEDTDGNMPTDTGEVISDEQRQHLVDLCDKTDSDKIKLCAKMKVDSLAAIRVRDYPRALEALNHNAKLKGIKL